MATRLSGRLLIVDDEPDINIALAKVLEQYGFMVDSYRNPLSALDNFRRHYYDLAILDIKMPEMNGFSLYREIKRTGQGSERSVFLQREKCITEFILIYFLHYQPIISYESRLKIKNFYIVLTKF